MMPPELQKPGVMAHACHPITWEEDQDFKAILGYIMNPRPARVT